MNFLVPMRSTCIHNLSYKYSDRCIFQSNITPISQSVIFLSGVFHFLHKFLPFTWWCSKICFLFFRITLLNRKNIPKTPVLPMIIILPQQVFFLLIRRQQILTQLFLKLRTKYIGENQHPSQSKPTTILRMDAHSIYFLKHKCPKISVITGYNTVTKIFMNKFLQIGHVLLTV